MKTYRKVIQAWMPLAMVITALCGLIYLVQQQSLRINANDPQVQMAEDTAAALSQGASLESVLPDNKVDIASSLAPFVIIFDDSGNPIVSSALLHEKIPAYPTGVFDFVRQNGEDRVTWQPEPGVRIASVAVAYSGSQKGFVVAGSSLREVEKRIDQLGSLIILAWSVTILVSLAFVTLVVLSTQKNDKPQIV